MSFKLLAWKSSWTKQWPWFEMHSVMSQQVHYDEINSGRLFPLELHTSLIARLMGTTWGPPGANRTQVGPMLAPWTLLSGSLCGLYWGVPLPRVTFRAQIPKPRAYFWQVNIWGKIPWNNIKNGLMIRIFSSAKYMFSTKIFLAKGIRSKTRDGQKDGVKPIHPQQLRCVGGYNKWKGDTSMNTHVTIWIEESSWEVWDTLFYQLSHGMPLDNLR